MTAVDLELAETEGFYDLFRATPPALAREHGIAWTEVGRARCGAVQALSGNRMLNHVLGLGVEEEATDGDLEAIEDFYGRIGARHIVSVAPDARPSDLAERLAARGYRPDYSWAKFRRRVDSPPEVETHLRLERIGHEHAEAFGRIVATAFGLPDWVGPWAAAIVGRPRWSVYLAFAGDEPAAAAALYVRGDVGWLSFGTTLPAFRRRGAQSALLAARIREAAERGCTAVATETGELVEGRASNSYRNIMRAGFELVYVRPNYLSPAP